MYLDSETEKKLAGSLTAGNLVELLPYLPYLLFDFWELGTTPSMVSDLVRRHIPEPCKRRFLDLGCGKGAVSVTLAADFSASVTGIDIMQDFIAFAKMKAEEAGVSELCRFRIGDITREVYAENGYDCTILGAVGDVLGTPEQTVRLLKKTVVPGGFIIIDDAYLPDADATLAYQHQDYLQRKEWLAGFARCGVRLVEEISVEGHPAAESNASDMEKIRARAEELKVRYPERRNLFNTYVANQENEYHDLEQMLIGVVWLLQT